MFYDYGMSYLVAFVVLAVSAGYIALITRKKDVQPQAPPPTLVPHATKPAEDKVHMRADPKMNSERFNAFLKLAKWAYCTRIPEDKIEEFRCHGTSGSYEFRFKSKRGSISLWLCTNIPIWEDQKYLNAYVVALPGTDVLQDIAIDINLALGNCEEYSKEVRELRKDVTDFLQTALPDIKVYRLLVCGHSKAASLGESLHQTFQRDKKFKSHAAITYDSPGQPYDYRKTWIDDDKREIYTLNSVPNFINTLNPPCAHNLWSCGEGSSIKLDVFFSASSNVFCFIKGSYLMTLEKPITFVFKQMSSFCFKEAKKNLDTHSLDHMEQFLKTYEINFEQPSRWPLYSGAAVKFLGDAVNFVSFPFRSVFRMICTSFTGDLATEVEEPLKDNSLPEPEDTPFLFKEEATKKTYDLPVLPVDIATMVPKTVYEARFENGRCPFFDQLTDDDSIIPIIGFTASGKTTLISRWSNQDLDNFPIFGCEPNNSIFPLIMVWKVYEDDGITRRIYLVDLPGVGAPKQAEKDNFDEGHIFHGNFKGLLELTLKYSNAALFIYRLGTKTDEIQAILKELREETSRTNTALMIGVNTNSDLGDCDFDKFSKKWDAQSLTFVLDESFCYPKPQSAFSKVNGETLFECAKRRFAKGNCPSYSVVQCQHFFREKLRFPVVIPFCAMHPTAACPNHLYPLENLEIELDKFERENVTTINKRAVRKSNVQKQLTVLRCRELELTDILRVQTETRSWYQFTSETVKGGNYYICYSYIYIKVSFTKVS